MIKKLKEKLQKKKVDSTDLDEGRNKDNRGEVDGVSEPSLEREAGGAVENVSGDARVIVVGHENTFSPAVMDYAIGFAERMGYEIVALNVGPITKPNTEALGPYCDLVRGQFEEKCKESAQVFKRACDEKGIPFRHVVKFGDVDECIREVHDELEKVEFVIADPESCPGEGEVAIPVFCMTK